MDAWEGGDVFDFFAALDMHKQQAKKILKKLNGQDRTGLHGR